MRSLLVLSTFPNPEIARQIGTTLVGKQLAACVNITPSIESIFRWQGSVDRETEVLALIKTTAETYPQLEKTLKELHPYDVPEIIALEITKGSQAYLDWIRESTGAPDGQSD